MTQEEKDRIDYKIYAKRKDSEENIKSWGCAFLVSIIIASVIVVLIKLITA